MAGQVGVLPVLVILAAATRVLNDEYGNTYLYVDEDMCLRLETKLIHSIVTGFKVLPV